MWRKRAVPGWDPGQVLSVCWGEGGPRPPVWALGVHRDLTGRENEGHSTLKPGEAESCALSQVGGGHPATAGGSHARLCSQKGVFQEKSEMQLFLSALKKKPFMEKLNPVN